MTSSLHISDGSASWRILNSTFSKFWNISKLTERGIKNPVHHVFSTLPHISPSILGWYQDLLTLKTVQTTILIPHLHLSLIPSIQQITSSSYSTSMLLCSSIRDPLWRFSSVILILECRMCLRERKRDIFYGQTHLDTNRTNKQTTTTLCYHQHIPSLNKPFYSKNIPSQIAMLYCHFYNFTPSSTTHHNHHHSPYFLHLLFFVVPSLTQLIPCWWKWKRYAIIKE